MSTRSSTSLGRAEAGLSCHLYAIGLLGSALLRYDDRIEGAIGMLVLNWQGTSLI
jgi:hypothetical protein